MFFFLKIDKSIKYTLYYLYAIIMHLNSLILKSNKYWPKIKDLTSKAIYKI